MYRRISSKTIVFTAVLALVLGLPAAAGSRIEKEYPLPPGGAFELDADVGSVTVRGGSSDGARVVITARSEDLLDQFDLSADADGGRVEVRFEKKGSNLSRWFNWGRSGNVQFEIEVPIQTDVSIDTAGGAIRIEDLDGEVSADTSGGPIYVSHVRGEVLADTSGGPIEVDEIDGDVNADTSGGPIRVDGVRGSVNADTSGGPIQMRDVSGDVNADTSGGPIEIVGAGGRVLADTSGGGIVVAFTPGNGRGGDLSTSGGGIDVSIDPSVGLDLDAVASGGVVQADVEVTVRGRIEKSSLQGRIAGGGNTLRVRTSGGRIRIRPL